MPLNWEVFPTPAWPRHFGLRERPARAVPADPWCQLDLFADGPGDGRVIGSIAPGAVDNLRAVWHRSRLSRGAFAQWVLGCNAYTFTRWLRGERRMPQHRALLASRLVSVNIHGDHLVILLHTGFLRPRYGFTRARARE